MTAPATLARQGELDFTRAIPGALPHGHDPFGASVEAVARFARAARLVRRSFAIRASGLESLPSNGPVLLVANHPGPLPVGALALAATLLLDAPSPRLPRYELERWAAGAPWIGLLLRRLGHVVSSPRNVAALLERGEVVVHVPPAARAGRGASLGAFGREVLKIAARARALVIPTAIAGADEVFPVARLELVGRLLGTRRTPAIPLGLPKLGPVHVALGTPRATDALEGHAIDALALELEEDVATLLRSHP